MSTYAEKLRDPRWQRKRMEILQRDGWACFGCGGADNTLHVHHRYYISGRDPWEYPEFCYVTLCDICHTSAHERPPAEFFFEAAAIRGFRMPASPYAELGRIGPIV